MRIHYYLLLIGSVLSLSGCTLIARPEALITLQLTLPTPTADAVWPDGLVLGSVRTVSALEGNRVLVVENATLKQHQGVRWAESPSILLAEQLQLRRLRAIEDSALGVDRSARLDVWLSRFDLLVDSDGTRSARVALSVELTCLRSDTRIEFSPVESSQSVQTADVQALAEAFNLATGEAVESMLRSAGAQLHACVE